jgi:hypothetical protein
VATFNQPPPNLYRGAADARHDILRRTHCGVGLTAVKIDFQPTSPGEAAALSDFLGRMFQLRVGTSFLAENQMGWKYWSDRPDWAGSRSFTARYDGAIVAHAAAWPVHVRVPGQVVPAVHLIDWAADPKYPGAGIWLLRQIGTKVHLMIATGGSEITRRILPVIGFRPHGELYWFARPVRPLGQALTAAERNWRLPARLLRNTFWRLLPPLSLPRGWSALPLAPEEVADALWPEPSPAQAVTARDASFYRYLVDSPSARHVLFGLKKSRELVGYFCLALVPHVARIADLWLPSTNADDWCAGFRTAAVVAAREKGIYEISAWASTALGREGLFRAGFRVRERSVLSVFGDAKILEGRELHVPMLASDASFLSGEAVSYLT